MQMGKSIENSKIETITVLKHIIVIDRKHFEFGRVNKLEYTHKKEEIISQT